MDEIKEQEPPVEAEQTKEPDQPAANLPPDEASSVHIEEVASVMPDVVPDAVAAAAEKEKAVKSEAAKTYDSKGNLFEPSKHAVDASGKPILTPTGKFKKLPAAKQALNMPSGPAQPSIEDVKEAQSRRACAEVATALFIQVGVALFGDEWQPVKTQEEDERGNLVIVTDEYLKTLGVINVPPWAVVVLAYSMYGIKRFQKPVTKSRIEKFKAWIASKWLGLLQWNATRKAK
jgi:hypothetical protein